jgi:hypothetical protein
VRGCGAAWTTVTREQADPGIDVVSDGELGKMGFGLPYYGHRTDQLHRE